MKPFLYNSVTILFNDFTEKFDDFLHYADLLTKDIIILPLLKSNTKQTADVNLF